MKLNYKSDRLIMPTYKRYVLRNLETVYFFTKKPYAIMDRQWCESNGSCHPLCRLQEYEALFDFKELPPNQLIEVQINVKLKNSKI